MDGDTSLISAEPDLLVPVGPVGEALNVTQDAFGILPHVGPSLVLDAVFLGQNVAQVLLRRCQVWKIGELLTEKVDDVEMVRACAPKTAMMDEETVYQGYGSMDRVDSYSAPPLVLECIDGRLEKLASSFEER